MGKRPLELAQVSLPSWTEAFSGYGYGYGSGYWRIVVASLLDKCKRLRELWTSDSFLALWKSNSKGLPLNGGAASTGAREGLIQKESGPLSLCHAGTLHATLKPEKWQGDRLWLVAMHGEVAITDDKVGALEREIICEIN